MLCQRNEVSSFSQRQLPKRDGLIFDPFRNAKFAKSNLTLFLWGLWRLPPRSGHPLDARSAQIVGSGYRSAC